MFRSKKSLKNQLGGLQAKRNGDNFEALIERACIRDRGNFEYKKFLIFHGDKIDVTVKYKFLVNPFLIFYLIIQPMIKMQK